MKYSRIPKWDRHRSIFLKLGFVFSLAVVLMAFNYTSYEPIPEYYEVEEPVWVDNILTPPPTVHKKKVLPPPPKPNILMDIKDIIDEDPVFEEEDPFEEEIIEDNTIDDPSLDITNYTSEKVAPKPIEIIPEETKDTPISIAERMPVYGDCNLDDSETARKECTTKSMMEVIYSHTKYPKAARELGVEGVVHASFIVTKSGTVKDITILRDFGFGSGDAVIKALKELEKFYPGKQNGRPVSVIYRIPVKFSLN